MLKINISFSKKVPGEEQYSSLSFHGSMERELSDGLKAEQIQQEMHRSYVLLENTVEQEIKNYKQSGQSPQNMPTQQAFTPAPSANAAAPVSSYRKPQSTENKASQKQVKFLNRLGAENGLSQKQIDTMAFNNFGLSNIWELTKKQASDLIEHLQDLKVA